MRSKVIHRGDVGRGALCCGAKELEAAFRGEVKQRNWSWNIEDVTCKRCIAMYKRELAERFGK